MPVRVATLLALLALGVSVTACGESEKDKYIDDYKPLNEKLIGLGRDLSGAVQAADKQSDAELAKQFDTLATELGALNEDIAALDTPSDLKDEAKALNGKLDDTVDDLEDIAKAARQGNAEDAAAATVQLSSDSEDVNTAQNELAKATGAEVGAR